jgi:hypothetical protein
MVIYALDVVNNLKTFTHVLKDRRDKNVLNGLISQDIWSKFFSLCIDGSIETLQVLILCDFYFWRQKCFEWSYLSRCLE